MSASTNTELPPSSRLKRSPESRFRLSLPGIAVFNYHGLTDSFSAGIPEATQIYWLTPAQFRAHLAHIQQAGFRVAALEELTTHHPRRNTGVPATVLTFDDGLESDYTCALPLLRTFGAPATFFVNTSTIGQPGYVSWSQLAEMRDAGMSIQSHSHRHMDLTVLSPEVLKHDLSVSKQQVEDRLGRAVRFLAPPHGIVNRRVLEVALALGYEAVCSTRCVPARPGSKVITRITLRSDVQLSDFHGFLTGQPYRYARRLFPGLIYRPLGMASHLLQLVRYRWLKQTVPVSK
ncbi:MAG TPA: polysaccharide deacetylase family protein [Terriglobales bacterium]|nr:polysaccharide deacetylase family protein [Terriglobales bacterium]